MCSQLIYIKFFRASKLVMKTWLFDRVGCDKNFKHEWVHEWMQNIDCVPLKLPLCSIKMLHHVGFHSGPAHAPTYVIISIASFLSLVTKQQFFQVFHQSLAFVCVPQVQTYQRPFFCQGTERWIRPLRMEFLENTFKFLGTGHLTHLKGIPCQLSYMLLTAWVLHWPPF